MWFLASTWYKNDPVKIFWKNLLGLLMKLRSKEAAWSKNKNSVNRKKFFSLLHLKFTMHLLLTSPLWLKIDFLFAQILIFYFNFFARHYRSEKNQHAIHVIDSKDIVTLFQHVFGSALKRISTWICILWHVVDISRCQKANEL